MDRIFNRIYQSALVDIQYVVVNTIADKQPSIASVLELPSAWATRGCLLQPRLANGQH